jgi:preprotein translocase subunit SecG
MSNIILVILLILALCLIVTVLLQRSEGGGLGIGGGGGNGTGGRPPASPVAKLTWFFGAGFMAACLALTVISSRDAANDSLLSGDLKAPTAAETNDTTSPLGAGSLLPPTAEDQPATPPTAEE